MNQQLEVGSRRSEEARPAPVQREGAQAAVHSRPVETDAVCWCCGGRTLKRHCKIVCANCGFTRDCSDP